MIVWSNVTAAKGRTPSLTDSPSQVELSWEIEVVPADYAGEISVATIDELKVMLKVWLILCVIDKLVAFCILYF